jgi:hypothetical protein
MTKTTNNEQKLSAGPNPLDPRRPKPRECCIEYLQGGIDAMDELIDVLSTSPPRLRGEGSSIIDVLRQVIEKWTKTLKEKND